MLDLSALSVAKEAEAIVNEPEILPLSALSVAKEADAAVKDPEISLAI